MVMPIQWKKEKQIMSEDEKELLFSQLNCLNNTLSILTSIIIFKSRTGRLMPDDSAEYYNNFIQELINDQNEMFKDYFAKGAENATS